MFKFYLLKHVVSKPLHAYADWRIGATEPEKRCYKDSDSVLLTFDDFGNAEQITALLKILGDNSVKAMFFLQGDWAGTNPLLLKQIADAGHVIGNHTYSHARLRGMPAEAVRKQITEANLAGPWLRPPYGAYNAKVRSIAKGLGYDICYWTIDSRDWTGVSVEEMRHTILSELHPGAVILFHAHANNTIELLPGIIQDIRGRGFSLTGFDEVWGPGN